MAAQEFSELPEDFGDLVAAAAEIRAAQHGAIEFRWSAWKPSDGGPGIPRAPGDFADPVRAPAEIRAAQYPAIELR